MSVLIKGMKMPTAEQGVRTINIYADGVVTNYAEVTIGKAIPVPPHGRLIDADEMVASVKRQTEIMREIAKEVDKLKPIANSKELDDVDIVAIAETVEKGVLQEIANAPTILEAEGGK